MYSGSLKYKDKNYLVSFKTKPSMQTTMFDSVSGHWLPIDILFKKKRERDSFIEDVPSTIQLSITNENIVIISWNIYSIKQFTYKGDKNAVIHFNMCSKEEKND